MITKHETIKKTRQNNYYFKAVLNTANPIRKISK